MKGYTNKLLYCDLTRLTTEARPLDEALAREYIGGSGLAAKILYDGTDKNTDPLGPDNLLIFMSGPFSSTRAICSSRYSVVAKSPLTGLFGEASSGGSWGVALKQSGFDGIVIQGKAQDPVYLWINNGEVELRSASNLWGKDTFETDNLIKNETNPKAVIASIGPAGEKQVPLAGIVNDGEHARTAARCGLGAVMGSKNLKAVAVLGNLPLEIHDADALKAAVKKEFGNIKEFAAGLKLLGTPGAVAGNEEFGSLPIQNWRHTGRWTEGASKITGATFLPEYGAGNYHCKSCVIGCGKNVELPGESGQSTEMAAPEYETLGLMGSNCLIDDPEVIFKANDLCNRYGLDTMSVAGTISFAMEAFEKGLITEKDTEGITLEWGNGEALLKTIQAIGEARGIGKLFGMGSRKAAMTLGGGSEAYAIHVKGLELPAHDPRAYSAGALSLSTSNRGACHLAGCAHSFERALSAPEIEIHGPLDSKDPEGKGPVTAKTQNYMGMMDALTVCKFLPFGRVSIPSYAEWYNHITGEDMDVDRFMACGERIFNIKRLYNINCGATREDDLFPDRMMKRKPLGEEAPEPLPLNEMLDEYYEYRGWSNDGIPSEQRLEQLGILKSESTVSRV